MIDTGSMRRAFRSLERFAPAEADVLAGLREGIVRRRRRRQVGSVVGVTGTATAVVLGVVITASGRGQDRVGGTPAPPSSPESPPPSSAPATVTNVVPPPTLPFTVGWLPDRFTLARWDVGTSDNYAYYGVLPEEIESFMVGVSAKRPAAPGGTVEERTTIAGRPGVIHRHGPNRTAVQLLWQLADGRWAVVGGRPPTLPLDTLRRVAENLAPQPTPLTAPFGLARLPDGYQAARWINHGNVSLLLCPTGTDPVGPAGGACLSVSLVAGTAPTEWPQSGSTPVSGKGMVPVDQELVVGGVRTRATADGTVAVAQIDAGHYAAATSTAAGVDRLREAVASVVLTR